MPKKEQPLIRVVKSRHPAETVQGIAKAATSIGRIMVTSDKNEKGEILRQHAIGSLVHARDVLSVWIYELTPMAKRDKSMKVIIELNKV